MAIAQVAVEGGKFDRSALKEQFKGRVPEYLLDGIFDAAEKEFNVLADNREQESKTLGGEFLRNISNDPQALALFVEGDNERFLKYVHQEAKNNLSAGNFKLLFGKDMDSSQVQDVTQVAGQNILDKFASVGSLEQSKFMNEKESELRTYSTRYC